MALPNLWTFDVETTLNAPEELGRAHPMWPDNRVVVLGVKASKGTTEPFISEPKYWADWDSPTTYDFIVGCNMSFDMLYLFKEKPSIKRWLQSNRLWDIQLVEYLLSGQQSKWMSLDEMCTKYGLPLKDDRIAKEYFDKGLGADKVPRELLDPYLIRDVENTEAIALKQMEEIGRASCRERV